MKGKTEKEEVFAPKKSKSYCLINLNDHFRPFQFDGFLHNIRSKLNTKKYENKAKKR